VGASLDYALGLASRGTVLNQLGRAVPTGLFTNEAVHERLQRVFSAPGRTNDFRKLKSRLVLVAVDLDTGEAAPFGTPGHDEVPISVAVQASAALPGLFPPVQIGGRHYVDGALRKTLHASVLLEQGLDLLFCLNPLVPYDGSEAPRRNGEPPHRDAVDRLVDGGLPQVLSQTFRAIIRSRLELGLKGYERQYPGTDILLFEPEPSDAKIFFTNPFSYSQRRWLAEHAYQETRQMLRARRSSINATLSRHGLSLGDSVLDDTRRSLVDPRVRPVGRTNQALRKLEGVLDDLEQRLLAA
jgi:predicted acylesterase/phospholipase RssA